MKHVLLTDVCIQVKVQNPAEVKEVFKNYSKVSGK